MCLTNRAIGVMRDEFRVRRRDVGTHDIELITDGGHDVEFRRRVTGEAGHLGGGVSGERVS